MTYLYTISYDEKKDDFYGIVDCQTEGGYFSLFTIDDTKEMIELIKTNVMKHIDDIEGLRTFLIAQEFLNEEDTIKLFPKTMF